jgi:hypothetical protein
LVDDPPSLFEVPGIFSGDHFTPTGLTPAISIRVSCDSNRIQRHFLPTGVGAFAPALSL